MRRAIRTRSNAIIADIAWIEGTMFRSKTRTLFIILGLSLLAGLVMIRPASVEAGIFNANNR